MTFYPKETRKKKKISVMISFKGQLEARVISLRLRGSDLME